MKRISFDSPHRRKHFAFFNSMEQPHFSVCAPVEVGKLLPHLVQHGLPFLPTMVYLVSAAANAVPELRWRIRGDEVVEHEAVHPSFAVATDEADVFSFCEVKFRGAYPEFLAAAQQRMAEMRRAPVFEDDPERDDYLFLSSLPWLAFTAVTHAMRLDPVDSVPRIIWGKYESVVGGDGGRVTMPLSVQAHHAVVDGRHVARFFDKLQRALDRPEQALAPG